MKVGSNLGTKFRRFICSESTDFYRFSDSIARHKEWITANGLPPVENS